MRAWNTQKTSKPRQRTKWGGNRVDRPLARTLHTNKNLTKLTRDVYNRLYLLASVWESDVRIADRTPILGKTTAGGVTLEK